MWRATLRAASRAASSSSGPTVAALRPLVAAHATGGSGAWLGVAWGVGLAGVAVWASDAHAAPAPAAAVDYTAVRKVMSYDVYVMRV